MCLALNSDYREKEASRTMTFTSVQNYPDYVMTGIELYTPIPPSTGTQEGFGYTVQIVPVSGEKIPENSLEEKDQSFESSEALQPGHFMEWTRHPDDPAYKGGFKVVVSQRADLYRFLSIPDTDNTIRVEGGLPPNKLANYKKDNVMAWGNGIKFLPAQDPALGAAAGTMVQTHAAISYGGESVSTKPRSEKERESGEIAVQSATNVLKSKSGDCGSFCNLFQAGMLGSGYSTRVVVGWNLASTPIGRHARAEVNARGVWVPVEPTFLYGDNPSNCIGAGQYVQSGKFFTTHFGLGVYVAIRDKAKNVYVIEQGNLQKPVIRIRLASKVNPGKEIYMAAAPWVVSLR